MNSHMNYIKLVYNINSDAYVYTYRKLIFGQTDNVSYGFQIQRRFHGLSFLSVPNDACSFSQRVTLSRYTLFFVVRPCFG